MLLNTAFKFVLNNHWDTKRFHASGHYRKVLNLYNKNIKVQLGVKHLEFLKPKIIKQWHEDIGKRSAYVANRSLSVLSKIFDVMIIEGKVDYNPCQCIKNFTEKKRSRYATKEEIKRIGEVLERKRCSSPDKVLFFYLLLFSGCRPSSLSKAKYEDLHPLLSDSGKEYGVLRLEGKMSQARGEPDTIIIPPNIYSLIGEGYPNEKIFKTKMPRRFWEHVVREAGCPDLWIRDLRRTFATQALSNGVNISTVGELLNHKSVQTTKRYAKLDNSARLEAMDKVTENLSQLLGV